jgi:hypothetical protein
MQKGQYLLLIDTLAAARKSDHRLIEKWAYLTIDTNQRWQASRKMKVRSAAFDT